MPNNFLSGIVAEERFESNLKYSQFMSESLGLNFDYNFPLNHNQILQVDEVLGNMIE